MKTLENPKLGFFFLLVLLEKQFLNKFVVWESQNFIFNLVMHVSSSIEDNFYLNVG